MPFIPDNSTQSFGNRPKMVPKNKYMQYDPLELAKAKAQISAEAKAGSGNAAASQLAGLAENEIATLKGVNQEQGGAGIIPGAVGWVAKKFGAPGTTNLKGLEAVNRETAMAMAKNLTGSSRGSATIFNKILKSEPTGFTPKNQQAGAIHGMIRTAMTLKKAQEALGPDANENDINAFISQHPLTPEESDQVTAAVENMFKKTKPTPGFNSMEEGKAFSPSANPLSKRVQGFANKFGGFGFDKPQNIITGKDGRKYRIIGGDPNNPDVEPV